MKLSIIITTYKSPELLKVCLDSIKENCSLTDLEIIVAEGSSQEETAMLMQENFPEVKYFPIKENVGFAKLVKKAYKNSSGEYILTLNGDIIVKKDSIEKLLDFLEKNPEVGIAGPKLLNFNETLQYSSFRFYTPLTIIYRRTFLGHLPFAKKHLDRFLMKEADHNKKMEVDWLMGSALITSRKAVSEIGLMDERFKMYFEDTDWCRRFWESGYKVVYFPESQMYHYHGKGSDSRNIWKSLFLNRLTWIHIISALKFFLTDTGKRNPRK